MKQSAGRPLESFYHLTKDLTPDQACQGTACFVARHRDPKVFARACQAEQRVYCLGMCYRAPACGRGDTRPTMAVHAREAIVLANLINGGTPQLHQYTEAGGYQALQKALRLPASSLIAEVEASTLRGRGGAGFPAGRKWRAVAEQTSPNKYIVANADEGDPGAYIDRFIMEDDPHRLIEAMAIAARGVGARKGYIYLRKEYPLAAQRLHRAIEAAGQAGFLGQAILKSDFDFDIELVIGEGSYVCGEETAMLNAIEGVRPEVRVRPPYPTERGLFGKPTLINNVETLASIPWIVLNGGSAYQALGFSKSRGTKIVSLNSLFKNPGLYEIEFGIPVRQIVEEIGGGLKSGTLKGVMIGGPLAGLVPPDLLDTAFGFEELRAISAGVGHGGIIAFDEQTSIAELIQHVFSFGRYESCGKCTPCRLGSGRIEEMFDRILRDGTTSVQDQKEWSDILSVLQETSLCGHGTGLAEFATSVVQYYSEELAQCFK